ncbi:DNA methylase [Stenotrophomonas maltophilia]|nr:N-6 DNA methylase [Stenotrophomonas maltophilia]REC86309.1 DNA methylase [Stenotrophomonas maltophilia]
MARTRNNNRNGRVDVSPQLSRKSSDRLGRYYTDTGIGSLLVNQLGVDSPANVIDLGAGHGVLSMAAAKRWSKCQLITVDVDHQSRLELSRKFSSDGMHRHIRTSALDWRLPEKVKSVAGVVDAGVCNPPFILPKWRDEYVDILRDAGFDRVPSVAGHIEAPAIFFAQNMRIIGDGGHLGIILPDSLISSKRYRWFRESLLLKYRVHRVVKLPRRSFRGTDALAHIVVMEKSKPVGDGVELAVFRDGKLQDELTVSRDQAADRMDCEYHRSLAQPRRASSNPARSIGSIGSVVRGSIENHVAKAKGIDVVHTTNIPSETCSRWSDFPIFECGKNGAAVDKYNFAEAGDILLARVGRNLELKLIGVSSGRVLITDCVYRIRVQEEYRDALLLSLGSERGRAWLRSQCYGVSAAQLPKSALLNFSFE